MMAVGRFEHAKPLSERFKILQSSDHVILFQFWLRLFVMFRFRANYETVNPWRGDQLVAWPLPTQGNMTCNKMDGHTSIILTCFIFVLS